MYFVSRHPIGAVTERASRRYNGGSIVRNGRLPRCRDESGGRLLIRVGRFVFGECLLTKKIISQTGENAAHAATT
jgi:hypothetical protein